MRQESRTIAVPEAVAAGAATQANDLREKVAVIYSDNLNGTYQLQVSWDGSHFSNEGAALVFTGATGAQGHVEVTFACTHFRWNCTAYAAGSGTSVCEGFNSRTT